MPNPKYKINNEKKCLNIGHAAWDSSNDSPKSHVVRSKVPRSILCYLEIRNLKTPRGEWICQDCQDYIVWKTKNPGRFVLPSKTYTKSTQATPEADTLEQIVDKLISLMVSPGTKFDEVPEIKWKSLYKYEFCLFQSRVVV